MTIQTLVGQVRKAFTHAVFLILFWLRPVCMAMLKLVALLAGLCSAVGFLGYQEFADWAWPLAAASFVSAAARWWYDSLIIRLAPAGTVIGHRWR